MKPERIGLLRGSSQTLQLIVLCFLSWNFTVLNEDVDKPTGVPFISLAQRLVGAKDQALLYESGRNGTNQATNRVIDPDGHLR